MRRIRTIPPKNAPFSYLGVDPGKTGAFCLLTEDDELLFSDWPKSDDPAEVAEKLNEWRAKYNIKFAILEKVAPMPKQGTQIKPGVKSMFTFGQNVGMWIAILRILAIPYQHMTPQSWRKELVTKADGRDPKAAVKNVVLRRFPNEDGLTGPRGGWKDGRADAALMALKARMMS